MPSSGHHTLSAFLTSASRLTLAPPALPRVLVLAQAEERGLTQLPVRGPLVERDLGDEVRAHPRRLPHARRWLERRRRAAERAELRAEPLQRRRGEPCADLARVPQAIAVVEADEESAELGSRALRRRVPADHELR